MNKEQQLLLQVVNHVLLNDPLVASHVRMLCQMKVPMQSPVEALPQEASIIQYVMSKGLTMVSYERLWTTLMACRHVAQNNIQGDFVECGVWRGGNALVAAEVFRLYGIKKNVWLFDTFKGMTEPNDFDQSAASGQSAFERFNASQRDAHNEWCYASLIDVKKNFEERGLLTDNVFFIEGDVRETLNGPLLPESIAVLRLDTDFYDSTKKELEVLYPRLIIGGALIIDDYGHWAGSRKATDEYFSACGNRPFLNFSDYSGRFGIKTV